MNQFVLLGGVVSGPSAPSSLKTFLKPIVGMKPWSLSLSGKRHVVRVDGTDELVQLYVEGFGVWNALTRSESVIRVAVATVEADYPGACKLRELSVRTGFCADRFDSWAL